ncbi:MAG: hypothetical protein ACR2MB_01345 [Acidimicrobiales bacterium]
MTVISLRAHRSRTCAAGRVGNDALAGDVEGVGAECPTVSVVIDDRSDGDDCERFGVASRIAQESSDQGGSILVAGVYESTVEAVAKLGERRALLLEHGG